MNSSIAPISLARKIIEVSDLCIGADPLARRNLLKKLRRDFIMMPHFVAGDSIIELPDTDLGFSTFDKKSTAGLGSELTIS